MLRKIILFTLLLTVQIAFCKNQPEDDWEEYTSPFYMYDVETKIVGKNESESAVREQLVNQALNGLARQIQVSIEDNAVMRRSQVDGVAHSSFDSETKYRTKVDLNLVETKSKYDKSTKTASAIAYLNKVKAREYYKGKIDDDLMRISALRKSAEVYQRDGFRQKATDELNQAIKLVNETESTLSFLQILAPSVAVECAETVNQQATSIKAQLSKLSQGTKVHIIHIDNNTAESQQIANKVSQLLTQNNATIVAPDEDADYDIIVEVTERTNDKNVAAYGVLLKYVDAKINVKKLSTAQTVYSNKLSGKGGGTDDQEALLDAYNKLNSKIESEFNNIHKVIQ